MWSKARHLLFLLGTTLFMQMAMAQNAAQTMEGAADVLITMPITIDGSMKNLQLLRGESYEDAAVSFARHHGLMDDQDQARVQGVISQLSTLLKDRMEEIQRPQPVVQFTIPLTIDGQTTELTKYVAESAESAVERYLKESPYAADAQRELYPQLLGLVNQKLESLSPPKKEMFAFTLTIDGKEATARHFEGGNVMDEALETLRSIGVNTAEPNAFVNEIAPQIANELQKRINALSQPQAETSTPAQAEPERRQPTQRELFSIPLTLNDQNALLVHYEGRTARESALQFLSTNGVSDANIINEFLPQLVQLIDNKMAEMLNAEAMEREKAAQQAQASMQPASSEQVRNLLLSVPINVGENQVNLQYYEGDSIERTVELFLQQVGLEGDPSYEQNRQQLVNLVQTRVQEQQQQAAAAPTQAEATTSGTTEQSSTPTNEQAPGATSRPLLSLPVTLSGNVYNVEVYEGQEPQHVANTFCVEKYELIRAEMGVQFDGDQLQQCQNVLTNSIHNALQQQQQGQPQTSSEQSTTSETTKQPTGEASSEQRSTPQRELLFTLDIDIDEESAQLPYYRDEDPEAVARAFCDKYRVDTSNIPALVQAIQEQLQALA